MKDLKIRNAAKEDFLDFNNLMLQVHRIHTEARPDIYRPNEQIITFDKFCSLAKEGSVMLAYTEEKILGAAVFFKKDYCSPNHMQRSVMLVDSIVVDEKFRNMGIGSLLMKKVEKEAERQGCAAIELSVCAFNAPAKKAYEHMGFLNKSIIMEKPIGKCNLPHNEKK